MKKYLINYKNKIILFILIGLGLISFLDKALAVGLLLVLFLTLITFLILLKIGIKDKEPYIIFLIALLIHLAVVLFIYYTEFKPFGGGADYDGYNQTAIEIAQRFKQGNFSLQGLGLNHYFPLLIGIIYTFTLPEMIVGQLFTIWLAGLSILFVYLIVLELSFSKKWAFLIGLIVCIYPSYVYFGSLLLKDTLMIPLVLSALFLFIKIMKNFSWKNFLIFYIILTCSIHFRFYIGYALLFSFIFCWFLISTLNLKKRLTYGIVIVLLLGFSPQVSGLGYYGIDSIERYLNPKTIIVYRETAYVSSETPSPEAPPSEPEAPSPEAPSSEAPSSETQPDFLSGSGSSFTVETSFESPSKFLKGYSQTFIYSSLGPFPWQIRYQRQLFSLFETIPLYFLFLILVLSIIRLIKRKGILKVIKHYRFAMPLLVFIVMSLGVISLFITNFGIIARVRMPTFICLLCLISISFSYEKIFNYRGSRVYRFLSRR